MKQNAHILGWMLAALVATGCSGGAATTPPATTQAASNATAASTADQPAATAPAATEPAVAATTAPATTEAPIVAEATPPIVQGETVLQLPNSEVGGAIDGALRSPVSFRIGSDFSIRLLDATNKRLLFYRADGQQQSTMTLTEAENPVDFIVNTSGDVFVFSRPDSGKARILQYNAAGTLAQQYEISTAVAAAADGLMLTANQELLLASGSGTYWPILRDQQVMPPALQPLARSQGVPTPRSPAIFQLRPDPTGAMRLGIVTLHGGITGDDMAQVGDVAMQVPQDAAFVNVDRAMNLYVARNVDMANAYTDPAARGPVDVWRVGPDGNVLASMRIEPGCNVGWRRFYIDQAGDAWTMCVGETTTTLMRYHFADTNGDPAPAIAEQPADVMWAPGKSFSAA